MPLSQADLEDIQAEAMADDVAIDLATMSLWTRSQAEAYFESGGTDKPTVDVSDEAAPVVKKIFPPLAPPKEPTPLRNMSDFEKYQDTLKPGDTYKQLEFPYSSQMLRDEAKFGSAWLTKAFRAFGSIAATNSVKITAVKEFHGGGAATKCILTVRYESEEPHRDGPLQTMLFVKMPHGQANKREKYMCACMYRSDGPEVLVAQRYYNRLPVKAPRTYFADRCDLTTNFIIITECLDYASEAAHPRNQPCALKPYQLQRAFSKFHDHYLATDPFEYYLVLVRKLGRLAGWYKSDPLRAAELNDTFPTAYSGGGLFGGGGTATAEQQTAMALRGFDGLLDFLRTKCRQLLPPDVGSDAAISDLGVQFTHLVKVLYPRFQRHLNANADFLAIGHANLNIDNAYWWRDDAGVLDCGLIDWANFGIQEVSKMLDMCLFGAGWPYEAVMAGGTTALLTAFRDEYEAAGGPSLPLAELELRFDMTLAITLQSQSGVPAQLYRRLKRDDWPSVKSVDDPRVDGDGDDAFLVRSYLCGLLYRVTRWRREGVYARLCKWAGEPLATTS